MYFLTAANRHYFPALRNLAGSIRYWAPGRRILVYDLGLGPLEREEVESWADASIVQGFLPRNAPPHVMRIHTYAWKPLAIAHAIGTYSPVLWIDAGSDLRSPPARIERFLKEDGHLFVQGQDIDMTLMSHDRCFQALGVSKETMKGRGHFAGNLQGYARGGEADRRILKPMARHALEKDCIAPDGSDLSNHRFDQTLLSILIYQSGLHVAPRTELISARREELSPDPREASAAVVYTARGASREYSTSVLFPDQGGAPPC